MTDLPQENLRPTPPALYNTPPLSICKALIEGFSTNNRRRHPSWANKDHIQDAGGKPLEPVHVRLITIGASHYCEKARWALDLVEADSSSPYYYTEDAHPPLFQGIATLKASGDEVSMTPMVVFKKPGNDDETLIYDSGKIVKHFCPQLYPSLIEGEIKDLEGYIGSHLGATARCFFYHHILHSQYYDELANVMTRNSSSIEKFLWGKLLDKGLAKGIRKLMKINDTSAALSLETIRKVFQEMSEKLKIDEDQKKEYLMDTKDHKYGFTAADLAFAALAAPLIAPPELESFVKIDESMLPKPLLNLKYELRKTLAGQHVLEMYRKHRLRGALNGTSRNYGSIPTNANGQITTITPKVVGRNKLPMGALALILGATISIGAIFGKETIFRSKL